LRSFTYDSILITPNFFLNAKAAKMAQRTQRCTQPATPTSLRATPITDYRLLITFFVPFGLWSRRIDLVNRLVYRVEDDDLLIYACRYHYDKK
jgi:hypothetical protein